MPIFSANRVSGVGNTIVAAEGYTERDFGRIMSECAINDMRLFNAAIARDFKEAQAMNEGTMVASELQALREFSVKEAWKGLKEKLKKLWSKIKGVFKTVYAKLSLWFNRNTKLYIAQHRKELLNKDCGGCKIPKFRNPKKGITDATFGLMDGNNSLIRVADVPYIKEVLDGKTAEEIMKALSDSETAEITGITKTLNDMTIPSADKIYEEAIKDIFDEPSENLTFSKVYGGKVQTLFDNLSGNTKYLKNLRKMDKEIDKIFKTAIRSLDKAESKAENDKKADEAKAYKLCSNMVSKAQTAINALSAAGIRVVKFAIKNDRALIAALVAYDPTKKESAMIECAFANGYDALHEETEDMTPEDVEAAAEEEGIQIDITVSGGEDVDVNVEDDTDDE